MTDDQLKASLFADQHCVLLKIDIDQSNLIFNLLTLIGDFYLDNDTIDFMKYIFDLLF